MIYIGFGAENVQLIFSMSASFISTTHYKQQIWSTSQYRIYISFWNIYEGILML